MGAILGALADLGYGYAYRVLDSQYFGLAQRRKRVFIVGNARDWAGPAEVLLEPEGRAGNPPARGAAREEVAKPLGGAAQSGGFRTTDVETGALVPAVAWCPQERDAKGADSDTKEGHLIPALADPLTHISPLRSYTNEGSNNFKLRNCIPFDTTQITHPDNRSRCEPGAPSHTLPKDGHPPAVAFVQNQREEVREVRIAMALQAEPGSHQDVRVVSTPAVAFSCKDSAQDAADEVSPTLRSMNNEGGNANGGGRVAVAFAERGTNVSCNDGDLAATMKTNLNNPGGRQLLGSSVGIRRLTPTECNRLQGFPDGWDNVKGSSDSSRYRQMGNAVSVPVIEWIGRRIVRIDAR